MAIITSMLRMEARRAKRSETRRRLESVSQRVEVLALVYRRLYLTGTADAVNLANYLDELVKRRFLMHGFEKDDTVRLELRLAAIEVDHSQAVAVGLIVNELVTNSLKYAFPLRRGTVSVLLEHVEPGTARLTVADDGIGMPADQVRGAWAWPGVGPGARQNGSLRIHDGTARRWDGGNPDLHCSKSSRRRRKFTKGHAAGHRLSHVSDCAVEGVKFAPEVPSRNPSAPEIFPMSPRNVPAPGLSGLVA
jgi:hypothetical protein